MVSFAVLASGSGTNFQALIDGIKSGEIKGAQIKVLVSDKPEAKAIERAKLAGIPVHVVKKDDYKTREEMDLAIKKIIDSYNVDYIYLLGYMRLVKAKEIFTAYANRTINLHPSLLPAFPGVDSQKQAFDYGCKVTGITIHLVTEGLDAGPIIYQKSADISECRNADEVHGVLRALEHEGVKNVASMLAKGRFIVEGRKTRYAKT